MWVLILAHLTGTLTQPPPPPAPSTTIPCSTISYLPALFGLWISQHVIREALQEPGYRVPKQPPPSRAGAAASGGAAGKCAARGQDGGGEQREGKRRRGERGVLFASIRRGATGAGMGYDGSGI